MNATSTTSPATGPYELLFRSLFQPGRGYSFPCDAAGGVDLDALSDGERVSYFYARTAIGCEFAMPVVRPSLLH